MMFTKIRDRLKILRSIKDRMLLENLKINSYRTQLNNFCHFGTKSYIITWSKMIDHYNNFLEIKKELIGKNNIIWVLTGKII